MNAFKIVADFEKVVSKFCGSKYAVAVDSCSSALFLCLKYHSAKVVDIPRRTYVSVPMQVIHAGAKIRWTDQEWLGSYQLHPYPIVDSARKLVKRMYTGNDMWDKDVCLSFHGKKPLKIGRGGMILTNDKKARDWYRKVRFDGRTPGVPVHEDKDIVLGYHFLMTPQLAAQGINLMMFIKDGFEVNDLDPDLSELSAFKEYVV